MDELIDSLIALLESGEHIPDEALEEIIDFLSSEAQIEEPEPTPIPDRADLLWILSGENPQAFTQYLQNFPDPELNALARNPTQLQQVIQRLSSQITMPSGEVSDGVAKAGLNSSNVYGFNYDPRSNRLKVRFNNGGVYQYEGVPSQIYKMFASGAVPAKTEGQNKWGVWWRGKVPSLGATFYELIRQGGYDYRKLR